MADSAPELRYGPTSGSLSGWLGIAVAALVAVGAPVGNPDTSGFGVAAVAAAAGLVIWMVTLRPRVLVRPPEVVEVRNVLSSWFVPLAAVTGIEVRALTRVETAEGRYDGLGVGRPVKDLRRSLRGRGSAPQASGAGSRVSAGTAGQEADLMITQVLLAAERARSDGYVAGPVRRVWALPELGVLGVLALAAFVLALV